ncbi:transcription elongation factor SPT6 [Trypanosoma grayi]|uniref:transcription elongation factor SPT6 n=1 Tax=Trypanosoma grayi TaxID=71804 RepID=UPI0004F3FF6E|nr:transcription elongation factor SPT6 [Trypanosoma grayi]KEG08389.1 transcription elongation factor SPT6 [Trypanosoma grayi]
MNETGSSGTAAAAAADVPPETIEDVLAGAMWVTGLTDPALCLDRLHETFNEVIFSCVEQEPETEELVGRLKTAADRQREERAKEDLRRALMELQDNTYVDDGVDEEEEAVGSAAAGDGDDDDDEDFSDDSQLMDDEEFLSWIHRNDAQRGEDNVELIAGPSADGTTATSGVELELHRVGLSEEDRHLTEDILPERLKAIEVKERRPRLGSRQLLHGYSYRIPLEYEAFWILRQLRSAGQPLAHNTRICAIATRPPAEVADEPVVVAIAYALRKMTQEYLEPAHLMMYHQSALHPLLCAVLEASPLMESAECMLPVASYAYSLETGRRQRPYVSETYVGFSAVADRPIGDEDLAWRRLDGENNDFAQRKPCFIELGRILVRILELDVLCHRLECNRQQLLLKLKDQPESSVQEQRVALEGLVFESGIEADLWQTFVSSLTASRGRGPTQVLKSLGLENAFKEYTITGLQYQENLLANAPIHVCQSPQSTPLMEWAQQVGATARTPRSGEAVLSLFNQAIVEQFSKLPILRKRLFDVFCAEGDLIVTYKQCKRKDDVYPLATFFVEHPRHYLDLLERERQGSVGLYYVLSEELVRREVKLRQLYDRSATDEWSAERERAMELLLLRLVDGLIPKVKAELSQFAQHCVQTQSVERLGLMCAQGPYEPTRLCLAAFDEDVLAWESEWNIVEALPLKRVLGHGRQPLPRVCAAYRSDTGVTYLSFVDEAGCFIGSTRWADCALNSESGRAADLLQNIQLEKLFARCNPTVIAVGASNVESLSLMRSLLRFLRERVYATFHVHIPVVWAPVEVARLYSSTTYADLETPGADPLSRTSVALARYVQDPLSVSCALFDKERTALRLSLGATVHTTSEQEDQLYVRMCWEMSLWVTACGVWVEDCVTRPNSVAPLQFLAGFGPSRARKLHQLLASRRPVSREECGHIIAESFGDYVARNATCSLRVGPPTDGSSGDATSLSRWHLLDQTLLPPQWYGAAAFVARAALKNVPSKLVALVDFMRLEAAEKRDRIDRHAHQQDMTTAIRQQHRPEWESLLGEREVELLQEEMIAAGKSFLRRPYRRLSHRELMTCLTGIVYCTRGDAPFTSRAVDTRSLMICEGDYMTGTVQGVRGGGPMIGVRLATSCGLGAFIAADDIDDDTMKQEVLQHIPPPREAGGAVQPPPLHTAVASWLRRGAPIQGIIIGCNWERCELRLRWCRPRDANPGNKHKNNNNGNRNNKRNMTQDEEIENDDDDDDDDEHYVSYAAVINDAASSANSLRTVRLNMDARVFATKISRHPLFRDTSSATAHAYLHDKKIGEVILRPATGTRNKAIAVVKIGERSMCNWLISEERHSDGAIYYRLRDKVTGREAEFGDVDEFLNGFIAPMVALVRDIREHRRFVESAREVQDALDAQRRSGLGFTYVLAEVGQQSRPPFYRVFTRGGATERNFYLHIDDSSIYVRVPIRRGGRGGGGGVDLKWVKCRNAEHVSEVVKGLARPR